MSLCRQGDLGLIEEGEEPTSSFYHRRLEPGRFVKRNKPFGPVDFVMGPEIQFEVTLLNTKGKPMTDRSISFRIDNNHSTKNPYAQHARNGVFHIDGVPTGQTGKFSVWGSGSKPSIKRSPPIHITESGKYQVTLQTKRIDGSNQFDLAVTSIINAEGEDVLDLVQTESRKSE